MNAKHLLRFIKHKLKHCSDDVVIFREEKYLTLNEVFQSLNLTAYVAASRAEESRGEQRGAEESRGEQRLARGEQRRAEERRGEQGRANVTHVVCCIWCWVRTSRTVTS